MPDRRPTWRPNTRLHIIRPSCVRENQANSPCQRRVPALCGGASTPATRLDLETRECGLDIRRGGSPHGGQSARSASSMSRRASSKIFRGPVSDAAATARLMGVPRRGRSTCDRAVTATPTRDARSARPRRQVMNQAIRGIRARRNRSITLAIPFAAALVFGIGCQGGGGGAGGLGGGASGRGGSGTGGALGGTGGDPSGSGGTAGTVGMTTGGAGAGGTATAGSVGTGGGAAGAGGQPVGPGGSGGTGSGGRAGAGGTGSGGRAGAAEGRTLAAPRAGAGELLPVAVADRCRPWGAASRIG